VIVSRSLSVDKAKITVPLLLAALFYDLTPDKTVTISSQSERPAGCFPHDHRRCQLLQKAQRRLRCNANRFR
jgi:hypothetical protein